MKNTLIFWASLACLSLQVDRASAQRVATAADATQTKVGGTYQPSSSTLFSGTVATSDPVYEVLGSYTSANTAFAAASNVKANMHYLDASGRMYRILNIVTASLGTSNNLRVRMRPLGTTAALMAAPGNTAGFIFEPTGNLLLPQFVANMPPAIQGALLSHMANTIDAQLSASASPSLRTETGNYTVATTDDAILFNLATAATVTLPDASANAGKTFKIGKVDETTNELTFSPAIRLAPGASGTLATLNYARTFVVQSNGTDWWVVNQF